MSKFEKKYGYDEGAFEGVFLSSELKEFLMSIAFRGNDPEEFLSISRIDSNWIDHIIVGFEASVDGENRDDNAFDSLAKQIRAISKKAKEIADEMDKIRKNTTIYSELDERCD